MPGDDGILRVLAVGNSFSADAVEQELWPLFHATGQKVIIGELYAQTYPTGFIINAGGSPRASRARILSIEGATWAKNRR